MVKSFFPKNIFGLYNRFSKNLMTIRLTIGMSLIGNFLGRSDVSAVIYSHKKVDGHYVPLPCDFQTYLPPVLIGLKTGLIDFIFDIIST